MSIPGGANMTKSNMTKGNMTGAAKNIISNMSAAGKAMNKTK
jgi:hypothetical protein